MDTTDTLTALTGSQAAALSDRLGGRLEDIGGKINEAESSDDLLGAIADAHMLARIFAALEHGEITLDPRIRSLLAFWRDDLREAHQRENEAHARAVRSRSDDTDPSFNAAIDEWSVRLQR